MSTIPVPGDEVPQTIEGWYVLHDVYSLDWEKWRGAESSERSSLIDSLSAWLAESQGVDGDTVAYSVLSQKGDIMFVHYRRDPDALHRAELGLRASGFFDYLKPTYSYFSVIEVSLYEVMAIAMKRLTERGLKPGTAEFEKEKDEEIERQKSRMDERLFRDIPPHHYICFYPMNKRRGEQVNWYAMPLSERRSMMRGHGTIGHKYYEIVTQVIGGSVGLDDWEWGVSLHSDDALVFKKLIYEMRFDPASSLFAEFGPFYIGIKAEGGELADRLKVGSSS